MSILDGTHVAKEKLDELKENVKSCKRKPHLVAVLTTDHPASEAYVRKKVAACTSVGIESQVLRLSPKNTHEFLWEVERLNREKNIDGILLQLPFPSYIDPKEIFLAIDPRKDVDGFHPENLGKLLVKDSTGFTPCTPLGIELLLDYYKIPIAGQRVVILGRSTIVGKPLSLLLLNRDATVTICHSKTPDLPFITKEADILIAAIGSPHFVRKDMVKEGVVIVDVGINRREDPRKKQGFSLVGDVAFDEVLPKVHAITPVPGGVGPMTIAMLLWNTYKSYKEHSA